MEVTRASMEQQPQRQDVTEATASVLLFDTADNPGVEFLQMLQQKGVKFATERVADKDALFKALKKADWDLLLVCEQVGADVVDQALGFVAQLQKDTGFVLLTPESLTIDSLTAAYRRGIAAVVSRRHPEYSVEVFVRAVERSRRNFQLSQLNQEKFDLRRNCEQLIAVNKEALAYLQDGIHVFGNEAYLALLGYSSLDDLVITPFIDLVPSDGREDIKRVFLDFQQKLRAGAGDANLEIGELPLVCQDEAGTVLRVAASLQPALYEGEECIQVILDADAGRQEQEETVAVMEGQGYPLFITHLDNLVEEARAAGASMGQVVHIHGSGFAAYIAVRGFGSLNAQMKALASELKNVLAADDLLVRFTENSFLALVKGQGNADAVDKLAGLLATFQAAMNDELGPDAQAPGIVFSHEVVAVDDQAGGAEALVRAFLPGQAGANAEGDRTGQPDPADSNVIPFADKAAAGKPAPVDDGAIPETEPAVAPGNAPDAGDDGPPDRQGLVDQARVNDALGRDQLRLYYDAVISVADIETEYYDIAAHLPDGGIATRDTLDADAAAGILGGKLDLWMLERGIKVIAELYKQGQEYRLLLPFSARSLGEKRLAEQLKTALQGTGLPPGVVTLDFSMTDLGQNLAGAVEQLGNLNDAGVPVCISGVFDIRELGDILAKAEIAMVRLQDAFIGRAASEEKYFRLLCQSVEKLRERKIKVLAGGIGDNELLSACCKARIDLVTGAYIQKEPLELQEESLAREMAV